MGQSPSSLFVNDGLTNIPFLQGCADFGYIYPSAKVSCSFPKKVCQDGDILVSVRAPVGSLNKANQAYCIGRGIAAISFNDGVNKHFGWHLLNYWVDNLKSVSQGSTFEAISKYDLANLLVSYFEKQDQDAIAHILDTLDEAIQKTEQLISKLKAIKQGLLHDLLTRGLDENGNLGNLRDRCKTATIEQILRKTPGAIKIGPFGSQIKKEDFVNNGYKVYGQENIISDDFEIGNRFITEAKFCSLKSCELYPGDIVITMMGTVGACSIFPENSKPGIMDSHLLRIQVDREMVDSNYLKIVISDTEIIRKQIAKMSHGSIMSGLSSAIIKKLSFPLLDLKEQLRVVSVVDSYNHYVKTEQNYLSKLRLLKKGLMHDLLTGKVRVNIPSEETEHENSHHS